MIVSSASDVQAQESGRLRGGRARAGARFCRRAPSGRRAAALLLHLPPSEIIALPAPAPGAVIKRTICPTCHGREAFSPHAVAASLLH